MARYKEKDETDLVWNRTRRQLTRDLDTKIQNFREELLNKILTDAWQKYVAALDTGALVQQLLAEVLNLGVEVAGQLPPRPVPD